MPRDSCEKRSGRTIGAVCAGAVVLAALPFVGVADVAQAGTVKVATFARPIDLRREWSVRKGDDPSFASSNAQHGGWDKRLPKYSSGDDGFEWYRLVIEMSPKAREEVRRAGGLRLLVGRLCSSALTVYVDGKAVGSVGSFDPGEMRCLPPTSIPIRPRDARFIMAVRYRFDPVRASVGRHRHLPKVRMRLGLPKEILAAVQALRKSREFSSFSGYVVPGFILLIIGLYHLLFFGLRRDLRDYLLFGLAALLLSAWHFGVLAMFSGLIAWRTANGLLTVVVELCFIVLIEFFHVFVFHRSPSRFWRAQQLILAVFVVLPMTMWLVEVDVYMLLPVRLYHIALMVTLAGQVILAAVRGLPNARATAITTLLAFAVVSQQYSGLSWIPHAGFMISGPAIAFLVFSFGISIAMALNFARTMNELDARHVELREAHAATARFVPTQFLEQLGREKIADVGLGDQVEREMTILFSDIRAFTSLSEKMTPEENFAFVNNYLGLMEPAIQRHGGFIDKYIGDAVMALFGDQDGAGADEAVAAGVAMIKALETFNTEFHSGADPVRIGIGLNTGRLMLGTVGSGDRMDSTVIGDAVNLTSRVEGMTKQYGTLVLITETTRRLLTRPRDFELRMIDRVKARGKDRLVTIYEVLAAERTATREAKLRTREIFEDAVQLYHQGDLAAAEAGFTRCREIHADDTVVALYLDRIASQ